MKTIDTLIPDIYEVIEGRGGWDETITQFLSETISSIAGNRFTKEQEPRTKLSPSSLGTQCERKLWYMFNEPDGGEKFDAETLGTFFYGDLLEALVISLAKASGHRVEGLQEPLEVFGMKGSGDCIIDGVVIDVKSASPYGFTKFQKNNVKNDDPFGYISQLSSYLYGYKDDPRVLNKNAAGFLVVGKVRFKLCLDMYDLTGEMAGKEEEVASARETIAGEMPPRTMHDEADGKSGNRKLGTYCSYCSRKKECWPSLRVFYYSNGPRYLTKVEKRPAETIREGKV